MIFLIDPYGKINIGHFSYVTKTFMQAFNELQVPYYLISPTPEIYLMEVPDYSGKKSIRFPAQMPNSKSEMLEYLQELIDYLNSSDKRNLIVFPWLPFLEEIEFENLVSKLNLNNSVVGISTLSQDSVINYGDNYKFQFENLFSEFPVCKSLWVWHSPNNNSSSKVRFLPEFHPHVKSDIKDNFDISFFGLLTGNRGLAELLFIALLNPKLKIKIKGPGFSLLRIWRPLKYKTLRYSNWKKNPLASIFATGISLFLSLLRFLPNVSFDSVPFENDDEFQKAIAESKSIFYGCKLPHSSGVALTALASEVPVLWFGRKGEAVRQLTSGFGIGRINYSDIFLPNKVFRKFNEIKSIKPTEMYPWKDFVIEVKQFVSEEFNEDVKSNLS
jgi:hypothetical protein